MKNCILLVLFSCFFMACKSKSVIITSAKEASEEKAVRSAKRKTDRIADRLIDRATQSIGAKYKYAGITKEGFDCSGLMYSIFNSENIVLPRNSFEQSKMGVVLNLKREKAQKGDLIFFKTDNNRQINHVGLIIEVHKDEILFIHSSTSKGVITSSSKQPYYRSTFIQINRIL